MERYFCRDKKDYCDILNCKSCEFAKGHGVIDGVYANDVLTTLFGESYNLAHLKQIIEADREGRIAILSEPMKPLVYKPNDTDAYDVVEVVHGQWINAIGNYQVAECSNCPARNLSLMALWD